MGGVLIAMPTHEDSLHIARFLHSTGISQINTCTSGSEVLRELGNDVTSIVVCGGRLRDMSIMQLAEYAPADASLIVMANPAILESCPPRCIKLSTPIRLNDLADTVSMLMHEKSRSRKKPLPRSGDDKAVIDSAKRLLMERNEMTEPEAYRYIQKYSMDYGLKMIETARKILGS